MWVFHHSYTVNLWWVRLHCHTVKFNNFSVCALNLSEFNSTFLLFVAHFTAWNHRQSPSNMFLCPITRRGKKKKCKLSENLWFLLRSSNLISFVIRENFFSSLLLAETQHRAVQRVRERRGEKRKENNFSTCCTFHLTSLRGLLV